VKQFFQGFCAPAAGTETQYAFSFAAYGEPQPTFAFLAAHIEIEFVDLYVSGVGRGRWAQFLCHLPYPPYYGSMAYPKVPAHAPYAHTFRI